MLSRLFLPLFLILFVSSQLFANSQMENFNPLLYSEKGKELIVGFDSEYNSGFASLAEVKQLSAEERQAYIDNEIVPLMKYLFGPLTYREIGGVKSILKIEINWDAAYLKNSEVILPYHYKGLWMVKNEFVATSNLILPVPKNEKVLFSSKWKKCTDGSPEHQTESFYWYFWDPTRYGCDHQMGVQYELVNFHFKTLSPFTQLTYPEYKQMIKVINNHEIIKATFAFGYIEDLVSPHPDTDRDIGVAQYRKFLSDFKIMLIDGYKIEDIFLSDYKSGASARKKVIGQLFKFKRASVNFEVKVLINAGVDQMDLFAKSFAHDHDSYFAWLGHSRVGSGFDAQVFRQMMANNPTYYSISKEYQLVYWGGCNSYSYYADPFFELKALAQPALDPTGTKGLDIIANALPSLFILNSKNAMVQLKALVNFDRPTSYQEIIKQMEMEAASFGIVTLAVVIGDEDNI